MSLARQLRSVKSAPSLKRAIHNSSASTKPSSLLSSQGSEYVSLSLNSLKAECRKKGLKISGKKAELIDRLNSFDVKIKNILTSNSIKSKVGISTSAKRSAKGDDSTIDFYRFPFENISNLSPPSFKIPILPDAFSKIAPAVDTSYKTTAPEDGSAGFKSGTLAGITGDSIKNDVLVLGNDDGEHVGEQISQTLFNGHSESTWGSGRSDDLSSRDKTILSSFAAAVAGWWMLGSLGNKKKKQK